MKKAAWHSLKTTGLADLGIMFYNMDMEFEGGLSKEIVAIPALVNWVFFNAIAWWNAGWWRFGSCDASGKRRQLLALREDYRSQ